MLEGRSGVSRAVEVLTDEHASEDRPLKPFLRWAGSKRKLLARLRSYWRPDYHQRYIEPFAGSACLFFELRPQQAILGDSNRDLIRLYRAVQLNPTHLFDRLTRIRRDAVTYYRWRSRNPAVMDDATRALRFLYLNRNCFNGIYRTNTAGNFNVPFGGKSGKPAGPLDRAEFMRAAQHLHCARLVTGDFSKTLAYARSGDFVYLDPPFAVSSRRVFAQYGQRVFDTSDVHRLAIELRRLHSIGAEFLVSYADCAEARELTAGWHAKKVFVRRNIAGFSGDRRMAGEWLISNCKVNVANGV